MFRQKSYKEFVTNRDIASENAIVEVLKGEYPDSKIYSEEVGYNQFQKHRAMLKNLPLLQEKCFTLRIFGSAAVDICKVSEGSIEARVFHKTKFVDFAAGALIVKEAGGNITDFNGYRVTSKTSDVIVSNGRVHKELVGLLVLD